MRKAIGGLNMLYPTPTTLVGAMVAGKPNFITIAHVGILNYGAHSNEPELISVGMGKSHYTNQGVRREKVFSVNIPDEAMLQATDYCGLVSGKNADKAALFTVTYGELESAPLIEACPFSMECRLYDVYELPRHDVFIGEVAQTWAREDVLTDGKPDLAKSRPLLFDMHSRSYWSMGEKAGVCWQEGKALKRSAQ